MYKLINVYFLDFKEKIFIIHWFVKIYFSSSLKHEEYHKECGQSRGSSKTVNIPGN